MHTHSHNRSILYLCSAVWLERQEGEVANNGWHISCFRRSIIRSDLKGVMTGHVQADRQNETCFSLGFLLEGETAASLLLCMSHLCKWDPQRPTPTQTAETTYSFIRQLEHMQGEATWSHLLFDSWQIMNRLAMQQSCLLSTPLVHVGWILFAINKKGINLTFLNLYSVHWKSLVVSLWWPVFGFPDIIFPSEKVIVVQ